MLRQRVGSVAAGNLGRGAGGAQHAVPAGIDRPKPLHGRLIARVGEHGLHVGRYVCGHELGFRLQVAACCVVQGNRKIVGAELRDAGRQAHDRVVMGRPGTMAADVRGSEGKVLIDLLARLDLQGDRLTVRIELAAGSLI
jgi:hypothetical protein